MEKFGVVWLLLFILCSGISLSLAAPEGALVTSLPGFNGTFPSKHYSGYVNVNEKNLFYYMVVSERNPIKDPVVLWLNGGPGCSSFDGFIYEHGPFNFRSSKPKGSLPKLKINKYSWSKVSTMIYLDSPAGVGFSYSKNKSDYITGDLQTAQDTHTFLLKWFEQYPEFVKNPFYISGESYAGVYVPSLASNVVKGNKAGVKPIINFKGYLIGNGVTDEKIDSNALVPFAHGMALISEDIFKMCENACKGNYWNTSNDYCQKALGFVDRTIAELNIYDILEPCYHYPEGKKNTKLPISFQKLGETDKPHPIRKRMFGRAWPFYWAPDKDGFLPLWNELEEEKFHVGCINDDLATTWLNDKSVRKAIHVNEEAGAWAICTRNIRYRRELPSMLEFHKNLTMGGYRALIFSGDHDMCVPYTGSEQWTKSLGYKVVDQWRYWGSDAQVFGYLQGYEHNLTFLTIKGAGHTVPEYKPKEALTFFQRWLDGNKI